MDVRKAVHRNHSALLLPLKPMRVLLMPVPRGLNDARQVVVQRLPTEFLTDARAIRHQPRQIARPPFAHHYRDRMPGYFAAGLDHVQHRIARATA